MSTGPSDTEDISNLRYVSWIERQAGVLAWLPETDPVRIVVVTSRRTGRWVFPKGSIDPGLSARETAAQEALEEAGLIGVVSDIPVGSYIIPKIRPPLIWAIKVSLYPMRIHTVQDEWLEMDQRTRRFVTIDEAEEVLAEPEMVEIAAKFVEEMQWR